jgi:hypothetical protein
MSSEIFVQFLKCEILMSDKFVPLAEGGGGDIKRRVRNNRKDDGFEYLRNWLTFVLLDPLFPMEKKNQFPIREYFNCSLHIKLVPRRTLTILSMNKRKRR